MHSRLSQGLLRAGIAAPFCLLLLGGCGDDGLPQGELGSNTIWLQELEGGQVISQTENTMMLAGIHNELVPGMVILSTEGLGAMRKVVSKNEVDGNTFVESAPAQLVEVFSELHIELNPRFTRDVVGEIESNVPGLTFRWLPDNEAVTRGADSKDTEVEFNTLEVDFGKLTVSGFQGISLDGTVSFKGEPELDVDISSSGGLESVLARLVTAYSFQMQGSLTVESLYGGSLESGATWFDNYIGSPHAFGWFVFIPRLTLESLLTGAASGGLTHTQTLNVAAQASATYTRGSDWVFEKDFNPSLTASTSGVDAEFELALVPLSITFAYQLYGLAGPYVTIYVGISATGTHTVQDGVEGIEAVVSGGLGGEVGLVVEPIPLPGNVIEIGWEPLSVSFDLNMEELYREFFPFQGTASIVVGDNGPAPDDIFEVILDGTRLGQTARGGTGRFRVGALRPGNHTLTIRCLDDGAEGRDVCTLGIDLANGFRFQNRSTALSDRLLLHETRNYRFTAPNQPVLAKKHRPLPRSSVGVELWKGFSIKQN